MDAKSIDIISDTYFITLIAKHGLLDAKKIVNKISEKLKNESKRRKMKVIESKLESYL